MLRQFILVRKKDLTGTSGIGVVAEGVVFEDGQAVLKWLRKPYSLGVYPSLKNLLDVHGHEGNTQVRFKRSRRQITKQSN
jgi:hypothetical protein